MPCVSVVQAWDARHAGELGDGAGQERVVVQGEELDGGVEGFRRDLGVAEAAGDDVGQAAQGGLDLCDGGGVFEDEVGVEGQPFLRSG